MCGIVAAAAGNNIVPVLVEGLKKLEYRGYDSAGLAVIGQAGIERVRIGQFGEHHRHGKRGDDLEHRTANSGNLDRAQGSPRPQADRGGRADQACGAMA